MLASPVSVEPSAVVGKDVNEDVKDGWVRSSPVFGKGLPGELAKKGEISLSDKRVVRIYFA